MLYVVLVKFSTLFPRFLVHDSVREFLIVFVGFAIFFDKSYIKIDKNWRAIIGVIAFEVCRRNIIVLK